MDKDYFIKTHYDEKADVLYVWWAKPEEVICVEPDEGIVLRLDANSDKLVGYTIIGFRRRFSKKSPTDKLTLPLVSESAIPENIYELLK